jgi:Domain of unknown function (DUF3361)
MVMSQTDLASSRSSSDWQSCSGDSVSLVSKLSASAPPRTLNNSADDHFVHEPPNCDLVRPFLAHSAVYSSEGSRRSQLTSSTSFESLQRSDSSRAAFGDFDPHLGTLSAFAFGDASRPVFLLPAPTYHVASVSYPANFAGMDTVNVPELVERLGSEEDAVRKMAVFKLQSNIGDPSFAEIFIQEGGLQKLKYLATHATGNTLAYSLTSFSRLLEVDKGWDFVDQDLIERVSTTDSAIEVHIVINLMAGRRVGGHPSACQYIKRSHVSPGLDRLTSSQRQSLVWGSSFGVQSLEAGNCSLSSISRNARQPAFVSGPCLVRECIAADQFSDEGRHYK